MKIADLLHDAVDELSEAGVDTPKLDAEVLLAQLLDTKRVDLILRRNDSVDDDLRARFMELIRRRAEREPVSQIVGRKEFWSRPIKVTPDVLTPRPETEGIVERATAIFPHDAELSVLDLCTGSGCIAAALASEFPRAHVTATDSSAAAIEVARENLSFAADRIELLQGNLFDAFGPRQFDLIVSNPPYIPEGDMASLPPEVKDYEPHQALSAGHDGLAFLGQIANYAGNYLEPGGWLILEIGSGQAAAMRETLNDAGCYDSITVEKDLAGIDRIVSARRSWKSS